MERKWLQPPVKPNEHSLEALKRRGEADPGFRALHMAVESIFANIDYVYQLHCYAPGEHTADMLSEKSQNDTDFEDVYVATELVFKGLGAFVRMEVDNAGEPPATTLCIPEVGARERSEAMAAFSNRPA